jgi:type I restriction enzyme R subunit
VIDEAHSSQSGEGSKAVKQVLAPGSLEQAQDEDAGEGQDEEDSINTIVETSMKQRGRIQNMSFFAWTAIPKGKTLELFGTPQSDFRGGQIICSDCAWGIRKPWKNRLARSACRTLV